MIMKPENASAMRHLCLEPELQEGGWIVQEELAKQK